MQLLIQPGDGVQPLLKAIRHAKKSVEILIFRFDRGEVERALVDAVERGVFVHALIAFTNHKGEKNLRKLETHFLAKGITVARTAGDLVRYHGKMMIVDRKELHLLAFNFTHLDIDHSRSFGIITRNRKLVTEAANLFEADCKRQNYVPGSAKFLVSPANARKELHRFIKGAKKELLIYDPKIADRAMLRLLDARREAGVDIRIVGKVAGGRLPARDLGRMRLHTRTIIRDQQSAYVGSQSLRQLELDARREIGVIFRDAKAIKALLRVFEEDWSASEHHKGKERRRNKVIPARAAKKFAKVVAREVPVEPIARKVAKAVKNGSKGEVNTKRIERSINHVIKDAVAISVKQAAKKAAKSMGEVA